LLNKFSSSVIIIIIIIIIIVIIIIIIIIIIIEIYIAPIQFCSRRFTKRSVP